MVRWLAALLVACVSCAASPPPETVEGAWGGSPPADDVEAGPVPGGGPLSADRLMHDVRFLASDTFRGRGSTTEDEARAARWLAEQTAAIGLQPVAGDRIHRFTTDGRPSQNVVAAITPSRLVDERIVVLGAHYDHDGVKGGRLYPGADDNASGVAALLGIARELAAHPDRIGRRVVFVFFGAEEIGLRGAWALTRSAVLPLDRVAVMVNVDMIGRPLQDQPTFRFAQRLLDIDAERSIGVAGLRDRPWLDAVVREACAGEGHRPITIDDLPERMRGMAETVSRARGDHFPFEHAGVPAVIFSSGESVDYHQPTDAADTLHPELLATRARIVLRTVVALTHAAIPERPSPVQPPLTASGG